MSSVGNGSRSLSVFWIIAHGGVAVLALIDHQGKYHVLGGYNTAT